MYRLGLRYKTMRLKRQWKNIVCWREMREFSSFFEWEVVGRGNNVCRIFWRNFTMRWTMKAIVKVYTLDFCLTYLQINYSPLPLFFLKTPLYSRKGIKTHTHENKENRKSKDSRSGTWKHVAIWKLYWWIIKNRKLTTCGEKSKKQESLWHITPKVSETGGSRTSEIW